ncbi:hypothetical protein [Candidatus Poriferisodalis sp.]|uniref:hypothetical protein n=1 Tax=Candidatus Poriferisodalis sp. TaxID=3101277 RepID=UPI003B02CED6
MTHDAIGTFTITYVGVSDDPRYNGDLDTITVQVIRAKTGRVSHARRSVRIH